MEVLSHRDPGAIAELVGAVRRGRVVCLLADRDLAGRGLPVRFAGRPITMPAGPAVVARRAGAWLVPAVCRYAGKEMAIVIGEPIAPRPGREGLIEMTQEVADFFTRTLAEQPEDWHMMQTFFKADASAAFLSTEDAPVRSAPVIGRPLQHRPGLPVLVRGSGRRAEPCARPGPLSHRARTPAARARARRAQPVGGPGPRP